MAQTTKKGNTENKAKPWIQVGKAYFSSKGTGHVILNLTDVTDKNTFLLKNNEDNKHELAKRQEQLREQLKKGNQEPNQAQERLLMAKAPDFQVFEMPEQETSKE